MDEVWELLHRGPNLPDEVGELLRRAPNLPDEVGEPGRTGVCAYSRKATLHSLTSFCFSFACAAFTSSAVSVRSALR
jgi:hypothetical protein